LIKRGQFLLLAFFALPTWLSAQINEARLAELGQAYLLPQNKMVADSLAEIFADSLWEYISIDRNFGKPLKSVRNLSVQFPEDQSFALYTWAVPGQTGDFSFHGFLWNPSWRGQKRVVLEDVGAADAPARWLKGGQWVGGICYDIITTKNHGEKLYTILSFRPGRSYHTKFVDAVELGTRYERMNFGARIFNIRYNGDERYKRRPYRLQFRYSTSLSAAVRWDNKHKGIICDHLAPSKPELVERWFAYGPDFSYDRIYWSKGQWQLTENYPLVRNLEVAPVNGNVPTTLDPKK
jgi:hypothetical protein